MKNILLIIPYGGVGGIEKLAVTFYEGYKKKGFNVKVIKIIGLKNDIIGFGEDEYILSDKDFSEYSVLKRILFYLKIPFLLRNFIIKNKINYSISFGDMANSFSAITYTNEIKIASLHAEKSIEFKDTKGVSRFFSWSLTRTYKNFNKVVAISQAIKNDLVRDCHYTFKNLVTIYNPHNQNRIKNKSLELLSSEENEMFDGKVILFLGRLSLQKSPWILIKAFSVLKDKDPKVRLVLIGDGDDEVEAYLQRLVNYYGLTESVFFLGRKSNPYKYLARVHCLALSSLYEGTPNVIVEAIALNIPIITTNCTDGIYEMMIDKEDTLTEEMRITDAGLVVNIITPDLKHTIPTNFEILDLDYKYSKALEVLMLDSINSKIRHFSKDKLLLKYDLNTVLDQYIKTL